MMTEFIIRDDLPLPEIEDTLDKYDFKSIVVGKYMFVPKDNIVEARSKMLLFMKRKDNIGVVLESRSVDKAGKKARGKDVVGLQIFRTK